MKNILLITITLFALSACGNKKTETETVEIPTTTTAENATTLTDDQIKKAGIQVGKMEQKQISSTLKVTGKIDVPPKNLVSISARESKRCSV